MTARSVTHHTFVIERHYDASPPRVFAAFADPDAKARWFSGPAEWERTVHRMDFRPGGTETSRTGPAGGPVHAFDGLYVDIVADQRIVFTYEMHLDDRLISASLTTVELRPEGVGTRLVFTEQDAFLDGYDDPAGREQGTAGLLDALGDELSRQPAGTTD